MSWRPLLFASIFLVAILAPMNSSLVGQAEAEDTIVCCDSISQNLYLIGSDSSGTMSPFAQDLSETTMTKTIANAVASEETVGTWSLPEVWPGTVPASTWSLSMAYEVTDAAGAQINATASLQIGSQTYSATTPAGNSFLAQGTGTLTFDIDVEATTISSSSNVVLTLTAQTVVFSLPTGDAKLEFQWGSEDADSHIEGEMPLLSLTLQDPEVEGSEVYFSVVIDSYWGTKILSNSDSLNMRVNGNLLSGDPIETSQGDGVRVTWTWLDAAGGEETVNAQVELVLQAGGATLSGSASFAIETFDSDSGTGTYYPPDEPLQTNGDGSPIEVVGTFEISPDEGAIRLTRETSITLGGEMAFWMRWGLDHIGDDVNDLSPVLKSFQEGSVTEDERVSRTIEPNEINEFERQMLTGASTSSGLCSYYLSVGLGLDSEELLGSFRNFETISIDLDLNGQQDVVNHPVTLVFRTSEFVDINQQITLLRNFITVQPAPLWSDLTLSFEGESSGFSAYLGPKILESTEVKLSHSRLPWGETITIEGSDLDQDVDFTFSFIPTNAPLNAPIPLLAGVGVALLVGLIVALRMTRTRERKILMLELVLVPMVAFIHFFAYPPLFVGGAVVFTILLWWISAAASPRSRPSIEALEQMNTPNIPCPACSTKNAVLSDERPLRFACAGCGRVIKLVA
ncbi:MAG: hypothetical protein L7S46_06655 [Candidatus Poseidoniaceae archaeon]|nr:hypothetical protein [Candidatus Poseidoniaceae archaeon]